LIPPKFIHRPRHPLVAEIRTLSHGPIRHSLHDLCLFFQIDELSLHVFAICFGLKKRGERVSCSTLLHELLVSSSVVLTDLVEAVHDQGGRAYPELPSFWTARFEMSREINLLDVARLVEDETVGNIPERENQAAFRNHCLLLDNHQGVAYPAGKASYLLDWCS